MNINEIVKFKTDVLATIKSCNHIDKLKELEIQYLGRKSKIRDMLTALDNLTSEDRAKIGAMINDLRFAIEEHILLKKNYLINNSKQNECFDITLPGIKYVNGHKHLITQAIETIEDIFTYLGFSVISTPDIDSSYHAFESLRMPKDHPARDEWETFFINEDTVLIPHTTSSQVQIMKKLKPPIRTITIGRCYRRQSDISHLPMFHQFEGLYIDKNVTVGYLKYIFDYFVKTFFGDNRKIRLRPYHFRFTEPSFEVDISCSLCDGKGKHGSQNCVCKNGWLELGGAGMVHPEVLKNGGIDSTIYSGCAFGWGIERVLLMKTGLDIGDIRILYQNDLKFLEQF